MAESINCSKFASHRGVEHFEQALSELSKRDNTTYLCPMSITALMNMKKKYNVVQEDGKLLSDLLINLEDHREVRLFSEFE